MRNNKNVLNNTIFYLIYLITVIVLLLVVRKNPEVKEVEKLPDGHVFAEYEYLSHSFNGKDIEIKFINEDEGDILIVSPEDLAIKYTESSTPYIQLINNIKQDTVINLLIPYRNVKVFE